MRLPSELAEAIRELSRGVPEAELRRASLRLTEAYRGEGAPRSMQSRAEQVAYVVVRMPATHSALREALAECAARVEGFTPRNMLDLGCGPGTAEWAATESLPTIVEIDAVERDEGLRSLAMRLAVASSQEAIRSTKWMSEDLRNLRLQKQYDLVVASYSLGELGKADQSSLVAKAWKACAGALVIVEPGTRRGFENIAEARRGLIGAGAELAAPCPHRLACPMQAASDWCHFSVRVERTAEHRRLKQGELGYEDEKFSYLVASRLPIQPAQTRVVRHPLRYSGHTKLQLCTVQGLQERTVTRSQKDLYRKVKRVDWGSAWDE